jgi:crotonobetaine/carnitine-CoA ligase
MKKLTFARDKSFSELLEEKANKNGDKTFLVYGNRKISYRELNEKANQLAYGLLRLGAKPGHGAGIMMTNCPEFLYAFFATQKIGMYTVPINTQLKKDGLAYIINHSEIRYLFIDSVQEGTVAEISDGIQNVRSIFSYRDEAPEDFIPAQDMRDFDELFARGLTENPAMPFDRNNICIIMYTSGTTGLPKGVVFRYATSKVKLLGVPPKMIYTAGDIFYTCLPLYHANALFICVTQSLHADGTVVLSKKFSATNFWKEVRESGCTTFNTIGAMIPILLKQPPQPLDAVNNVRLVVSAACPSTDWEPFEKRFNLRLFEAYGAVDGGGFTSFNIGNAPPGSIGKPIFGTWRIVDDKMADVGTDEVGELIFLAGKHQDTSVEFFKDEKSTNEKIIDGWLHTGDLVRMDRDGFLYFVGRCTENIRRRGENVSEYEVEKEVDKHPDVLESAAYGVPSELGEQDIMVTLVPVVGRSIDPFALHQFLQERLPKYALPRYIRIIDELPKTGTHRVMKNELKAQGVTPTTHDMERVRRKAGN